MAIAYVRDTGRIRGEAVSSVDLTYGTTPSVGHHLFLQSSVWHSGGGSLSSVADNQGNTWAIDVQAADSGSARASVASAKVATASGTVTVTATLGAAGSYAELVASEFSGLDTSTWVDKTATATAQSTSPVSGTTATTTVADELVMATVEVSVSSTDVGLDSPPTGYTNLALNQDADATIALSADYKIVAATGTQAASWGTLTGAWFWGGCIATYKGATGGGGGGTKSPPFFRVQQPRFYTRRRVV